MKNFLMLLPIKLVTQYSLTQEDMLFVDFLGDPFVVFKVLSDGYFPGLPLFDKRDKLRNSKRLQDGC